MGIYGWIGKQAMKDRFSRVGEWAGRNLGAWCVVLGVLLIVLGVAGGAFLGLYLGLYVCFFQGLVPRMDQRLPDVPRDRGDGRGDGGIRYDTRGGINPDRS